jgi:hypothetical protein
MRRKAPVKNSKAPIAYARGSERRALPNRDREGVGALADFLRILTAAVR